MYNRDLTYNWKVVPICDKQLLDVDSNDVLFSGDFRKCNVYKSGGGYDKFPDMCERRFNIRLSNQFVVQLFGCPLNCKYCYVTKEGVWGKYKEYTTVELVDFFIESGQEIFHLMGGSPALYIEHWEKIIKLLPSYSVFHSDLLLVEKDYTEDIIKSIKGHNTLYAVSIKGADSEEFLKNTRAKLNEKRFFNNLDLIVDLELDFYITYTGMSRDSIDKFEHMFTKRYGYFSSIESFSIDIIDYNAIK